MKMMKQVKLIAIDLDGTLLDNQKCLSLKNEEALRRCLAAGIHVVPATGRTWDGVPDKLRRLPGLRYAITTNGAVVFDAQEPRMIRERKLTNQSALELMELAEQFQIMYDPYIDGRGYTEARFFEHMEVYGVPPLIQDLVRKTRTVVPDIRKLVKDCGKPVEKVNYFFGDMQKREEVRRILSKRGDIEVSSSLENNLELNALGATKGDALRALADYLGIERSQTMACGDGENDFTMILQAGIGIAMKNGDDRLKSMADAVTVSNEADGVAAAIERFVFYHDKAGV